MNKKNVQVLLNRVELSLLSELLDTQLDTLHQLLNQTEDGTNASACLEKNINDLSNLLLKTVFAYNQLENEE